MTPRRRWSSRDLALVAAFAALIAVLGLPGAISLPFTPVPITAQTLAVMLAGVLLGPRLAPASVVLFLALVALGFPLLAGGRGGLAVFFGPSAGYLVGWIAGAAITGLLARPAVRGIAMRGGRPADLTQLVVACVLGGIVVVYAIGIPVLSWRTGLSLSKATVSAAAYLPGDLIKAVLASLAAATVARSYPPSVAEMGVR